MITAIKTSIGLLTRRQKVAYLSLVIGRIALNLLDLVAVAAVGLMGAILATGFSGEEEATFFGFTVNATSTDSLIDLAFFVAGFFISKSVLAAFFLHLSVVYLAKVESGLAVEIARYIFSGQLSRMRGFSKGEQLWATTSSPQQAITGLLTSASSMLTEGALFFAIFVVFLMVNPSVAILITIYFAVLLVIFQLAINKRLKRLGTVLTESSVGVTNTVGDLGSAFREIRVLGVGHEFVERFSASRRDLAFSTAIQNFLLSLPRYFVESALMLGVLVLIGRQLTSGELTDGIVTTSVFLAGGVKMMAALLPLQNSYANVKFYAPQALRAQELTHQARIATSVLEPSAPLTRPELRRLDSGRGLGVSVESVVYTHPDASEPVIKGISLEISAGAYVALVGPSGAGKTTLADLILGMNTPDSGEILIGGVAPERLYSELPGLISYVPQNPGLVAGSMAQNVALGAREEEIDEERVWKCLTRALLDDYVRSLPETIHSSIGKQADSLSGGQKQRLGLARALYTNPRLIVLDEATSALDAGTEASVTDTIRELGLATTVIVVAHRLSTIQHADTVFVIEDGRLTAEGKFSDVKKRVPLIERYVQLMTFDSV